MTLTDDVLGARLRSALQDLSPLATDPVPPPRFAPDATDVAPTGADAADVIDIGGPRLPHRRPHRRVAVAVGVLVAAAVAAGVVVVTTDLGRDRTAPAGGPATAPTSPVVPPSGPGNGLSAYPELLRCEARSGRILAATHVTTPDHYDVWTVSPDATCRAMPAEHGRYLFDPPRARNAEDQPAHIEGSSACLVASTRATTGRISFEAYGNGDYLEFFGPSCLIRSAPR